MVDVVTQGVGTTGQIGPFRSYDRATAMARRVVRAVNRTEGDGYASVDDVTAEIVVEIAELIAPAAWREGIE